jgi:2-polyprenyl-3-methyl-5-hydroxy-6-metoxy-1,4-benzoquinol methylase
MNNIILQPETSYTKEELKTISKKLLDFYDSSIKYTAFLEKSDHKVLWSEITKNINISKNNNYKKIDILEVGAGKTGFGEYIKEFKLDTFINYYAQDITKKNLVWLKKNANFIISDDLKNKKYHNKFDIIFSTYVLEHVVQPQTHLNTLFKSLRKNGSLFLFSPRYDFPGYTCPSIRHSTLFNRINVVFKQIFYRIKSFFLKKPMFLIQSDLAIFYKDFYTDADAVHWVSSIDLKYWAKQKSAIFRKINCFKEFSSLKDYVVKRFLTCAVEIRKDL